MWPTRSLIFARSASRAIAADGRLRVSARCAGARHVSTLPWYPYARRNSYPNKQNGPHLHLVWSRSRTSPSAARSTKDRRAASKAPRGAGRNARRRLAFAFCYASSAHDSRKRGNGSCTERCFPPVARGDPNAVCMCAARCELGALRPVVGSPTSVPEHESDGEPYLRTITLLYHTSPVNGSGTSAPASRSGSCSHTGCSEATVSPTRSCAQR